MLEVSQLVLGLVMSLLDDFTQKNWIVKINVRSNDFLF